MTSPFQGHTSVKYGAGGAGGAGAGKPKETVPSYVKVQKEQEVHLKTIDRWQWGNVKDVRARLEAEEAARKKKAEEEAKYWAERRRQALAYWDRLREQQQKEQKEDKLPVGTKVVVRGGNTANQKINVGVITAMAPDGTYAVKYAGGSSVQGIHRRDILLAPPEDEVLYVGARVGVQFPNDKEMYMGIITARNADGTYAVRYDGGTSHQAITRRAITLFHNEPMVIGERVEVTFGDGTKKTGVLASMEKDGTYTVNFDDGSVSSGISRDMLSLDHSKKLDAGQRVVVKFPNKPNPYYGVVKKVNEDGTYAIMYEGGHVHDSIARHMITPVDDEDPLEVGDRVSVKFPNGKDYKGVISKINDDYTYAVKYDGGTSHDAIVRSMITKLDVSSAAPITAGSHVSVSYPDGRNAQGVVKQVNKGGSCAVLLGDGTNDVVPMEFLTVLPSPGDEAKRIQAEIAREKGKIHLHKAPNVATGPTKELRNPQPLGKYDPQSNAEGASFSKDQLNPGALGNRWDHLSGDGSGNPRGGAGRNVGALGKWDPNAGKDDASGNLNNSRNIGNVGKWDPNAGKDDPKLKTLDKWEWDNASRIIKRLEDEERERKRREEEERRFWEEKRKRARENWLRWLMRQEDLKLRDKIVYGKTPDGRLYNGVIAGVNADGTFIVRLEDGTVEKNVPLENLLKAPGDDAVIYPGARVGVATTSGDELAMGIVTHALPDGTYNVKFDSGHVGEKIARRFITLYYNDALAVGDRVRVSDANGNFDYYGTIISVDTNKDLYGIRGDDGKIHNLVPRVLIMPIPSNVELIAGDEVQVASGKVQGELVTATIVEVNPDHSYKVELGNGVVQDRIVRKNIVGYNPGEGQFVKLFQAPGEDGTGHRSGYNNLDASNALPPDFSGSYQQEAEIEEPLLVGSGVAGMGEVGKLKKGAVDDSKQNYLNFSATVKMMSKGAEFTQYHEETKERVFMFYLRPEDGGENPSGSLHWCAVTKPPEPQKRTVEPGKSINLKGISDIFMGKKPEVFTSKLRKEAVGKQSFSVVVKDKTKAPVDATGEYPTQTLHFEAPNNEVRTMWINGINTIITSTGKKVQVAYKHEYRDDVKGQTIQRFPTLRKPITLVNVQPKEFGTMMGANKGGTMMRMSTLSTYSAQDMIEMMEGGSHFFAYSAYPEPIRQEIFIFYVRGVGPGNVGVLYWCDPQQERKVASTENSLPLAHISAVNLGKQSMVFKQVIAKDAVWNRCFSVLSYDGMHDLHLEAAIPQQVSAWLEGINSILS